MFEASTQYLIYNTTLLCIVMGISLISVGDQKVKFNIFISVLFSVYLILFIGIREWESSLYGDSFTYGSIFLYSNDTCEKTFSDPGFYLLMKLLKDFSVDCFFLVTAMLYIVPVLWASIRISNKSSFFILAAFATSMSFYSYGVNGIRNGIATSLVILALSFYKSWYKMILLMLLAGTFHGSINVLVIATILVYFYRNTKIYYIFWLLSLALSLVAGEFFQSLFLKFGFFEEKRIESYLTTDGQVIAGGVFRYDFLLYSIAPLIIAYFYLRKHNDNFYRLITNLYLVANSLWILAIRANFSNRLAYLSWFIMPLILIYPFILHSIENSGKFKYREVLIILLCNFLFMFALTIRNYI